MLLLLLLLPLLLLPLLRCCRCCRQGACTSADPAHAPLSLCQVIKAVLKDAADTTELSLLYANVSPDDILLREVRTRGLFGGSERVRELAARSPACHPHAGAALPPARLGCLPLSLSLTVLAALAVCQSQELDALAAAHPNFRVWYTGAS